MKPQWGGNRGRGRGARNRGRGWRGHSSGPRGGGPQQPFLPTPMEYRGGPQMMRGHRGGYRGRPPPDNFNQQFSQRSNEPPWARLRGRPYACGMLPEYQSGGLQQRRPFLSPPRSQTSPVRPSSPLPGSEEYMQRDISEKSAFLKRQLELEGPPPIISTFTPDNKFECDFASDSTTENFCDNPYTQSLTMQPTNNVQNKCDLQTPSENAASPRRNKRLTRRQKRQEEVLSVEEIHDKIINHISNLSHGKKVNLVNQAGPSGYDLAVQQITRQKRLELSKALRDMCNNKFKESVNSSEVINAIIPDFDIKIEELPREVVEQLSSTLHEDVEERIQTMCIDPEVMFQQAADMLNNMLDVESDVKNYVNLADCGAPLQDEFSGYSDFRSVVSGNVGLDINISQNIGDPSTDFVPNDAQMQPGCSDLPFDETMASTALNFHNDPMPCQSPPVNFSVPPPMNFSVPPPINFAIPPPSICEEPHNESSFTDFPVSQQDNSDSYNTAPAQAEEECVLYPEGTADDAQYYSPGQPCSEENSPQATPVFNDLMMGQDLLIDNNIEQTELSLPLNVDEGGLLLPTNSCDNPPFSLMDDQENEQYFDLNAEVDDSILMPPNEEPYNLIAGQDQLPENLTEQYVPNMDEVDNILLSSQPLPSVKKEGKAIILSDIRIPPPKATDHRARVSDVLTEAAELEACLAQGEVDLKMLDSSKSKKISFTFHKINNIIRPKMLVDDNDDISEMTNSKKLLPLGTPLKRKTHTEMTESSTATPKISKEPIKVEIKSEAAVETVLKTETAEKPQIECEEKVDLANVIKSDDIEPEQNKSADKIEVPEQETLEFEKSGNKNSPEQQVSDKIADMTASNIKIEDKSVKNTNTSESIKEEEKLPERLVPEESPGIEIEPTDKIKESTSEKPKHLKKVKSKSNSTDRESPPREKNDKKSSRKSNKMKPKSVEEEEFPERKKEKKSKSKSSELEEYPKSESYKSKYERSRYDIFYSQKCEDGYKKKYKEKGREMVDEDRHRRSDSDRSFEKQREKFRSSDSEHSENRYTKYHQEREDMRHSKRYYHDCYPPYRTDYVDYKNDYYNSQKYAYTPEYYSKQEAPYSPEDFEAKSSHHSQKHKSKYARTHKKRSKKHKRQREKSSTSLSSISSEERDSSTSSLSRRTKHKANLTDPVDTEERSTAKGHIIPLKDRIQMLYESKFDKKRERSLSDYDEDRKIKSEPVSPEITRKPSPERSRSVEKLQSRREPLVSANDLREALNKKALSKSIIGDNVNVSKALPTKLTHPGTPVVPFTNKPCPAQKQIEDPQREREEMIMNRDSMISFRNKPCPLGKKPGAEDEMELQEEQELQLAKELPDIDNIAKIISNLSTIVTPPKERKPEPKNVNENQKSSKRPANMLDSNEKTERAIANPEPPQKTEPKKFDQRPWKSPGEKKFMMEHLQRNPPYEEEELDYEPDKKAHLETSTHDDFTARDVNFAQTHINEEFFVKDETTQEEKLAYLNPEPTMEEESSNNFTDILQEKVPNVKLVSSGSSVLKLSNKEEKPKIPDIHTQDFLGNQTDSVPVKPQPERPLKLQETTVKPTRPSKEVDNHQTKPKSYPKLREPEEINSTSEKTNKSVPKSETLKDAEPIPLEPTQLRPKPSDPPKSTKFTPTDTKPASAESTFESTEQAKPQDAKGPKHKHRTRSKSRSRSKTKEMELLHSAEVSSTSDTAAKSAPKPSNDSRSRSKSKIRNTTPQLPKEESSNFKSETLTKSTEQPLIKTLDPAVIKPEDALTKMLITTYTQTETDGADNKKDAHKTRRSSKREKTHSGPSHKSKPRPNVSTQTSVTNTNSSTQTPTPRSRSVQVQMEVEEEKPTPKKAIFVQTDPVIIFDNHDDGDDFDDKLKHADKSGRKILKAVRRRRAVARMFDLDKEIERLTKLRQSMYKKLNFDSESDEDDSSNRETKIARLKIDKNPPVKTENFVKNSTPLPSSKNKPIAEKSHVNKKQKKRSDTNNEKQNCLSREEQLIVNVANLKTYKKGSSLDVKKGSEPSTKSIVKNQEAGSEEMCKREKVAVNMEKVRATSIEKTVPINTKSEIEKAKFNKSEKLKPNEHKHDVNKNLSDTNIKEKLKPNVQKSDPGTNMDAIYLPDKIPHEAVNPPKTPQKEEKPQLSSNNSEQLEFNKNSSQTDTINKELPEKNPTIENNEPELEKSEKHKLETIPKPLLLETTEVGTTPEQTDLNNPHPELGPTIGPTASEKPFKNNEDTAPNKPTQELIPDIKNETTAPIRDDHPPEKSNPANSEAEDSVRSTRSRHRKPKDAQQTATLEETAQAKPKRRYRKKTDLENEEEASENVQQTPTSEDPGHPKIDRKRKRRKADSESRPDTSAERDTSADEEAIQKKRSKSPKHSKDSKSIIKVKVKTTTEQKKRFQEHLKDSKEARSAPSKRRKKTATELLAEEFPDELSRTIDEVARNEITTTQNEAYTEIPSTKSRKREKAAKSSKSVPRLLKSFKAFDEETVSSADAKRDASSVTHSDHLQENQDLTSDSVAFRGFKNDPEPDREIGRINSATELLSVACEESVDTSNKLNGNVSEISTELKPSQKQKKRKKAIELDPEIDSQNLLQIQMIKRPKSAFEPYSDSARGTQKKKKTYPFSGGKLNYRTKKRKSSSDASTKSSSSLKKKPLTENPETKATNSNISNSIVRVTRYSMSQLEEMRRSIRRKTATIPATNSLEEVPARELAESTEPIGEEPPDAYNLKIVSVESLGSYVPHESKILPEPVPATDACDVIEEEIHLKEEMPSLNSMDCTPENESNNSINSALHLETSNEAFEDFVKESMHDYKEPPSEPPVLTPEVEDLNENELKISDCEFLEVVDEDDDYKMDFEGFSGAILVIKVIASTAIAASDKGKIFCFSMLTGHLINTFDMSKLAITSMIVIKRDETNLVYTGSLDSYVGILNFNTKEVLKHEKLPEPVQCMEYAWNCIFIGSDRGSLIRYDLNVDRVEEAIKISDFNVLMIKATQEGPRKVLVVATRNAPVCIRDAWSGLLLRTMQTPFSPTVYTLLFEKNLIYCGTSQHDILVYTFEDGQLIFKHEATKSKGVVCMQIIGNLLFAGCYNGNIYVYNTKTNIHLGTMNGPGGLLLSIEIVRNKIIVGTKSSNFRAWRIPQKYLDQM